MMTARKAAKKQAADSKATGDNIEPRVIVLAEQLGTFLGRVQRKADGLLENATLRKQASLIRDGAADLLKLVNRAGIVARKSVAKKVTARKSAAKSAKRARKGAAEAPAKRLRKPPPEELFDPLLGEPMGKQMGQKNLKRGRSGRG